VFSPPFNIVQVHQAGVKTSEKINQPGVVASRGAPQSVHVARRVHMLAKEHPAYLETVPFATIAKFTALQAAYVLAVWAITWAGVAGVLFPVLIIVLIPARQHLMPRLFDAWSLSQLDAAEYEEAPPAPEWVVRAAAAREGATAREEYEAREALDAEMPGHRGAIRHHISADEMRRRSRLAHDHPGSLELENVGRMPVAAATRELHSEGRGTDVV
jgi:boron transporter